jgi:hypothetical protein
MLSQDKKNKLLNEIRRNRNILPEVKEAILKNIDKFTNIQLGKLIKEIADGQIKLDDVIETGDFQEKKKKKLQAKHLPETKNKDYKAVELPPNLKG